MSGWVTRLRSMRGVILISVGVFLLGLAAGFTLRGTSFDPAMFEALGTWVGGLGTVAAIAFAVQVFRVEERHRHGEVQASEDGARRAAKQVHAEITKGYSTQGQPAAIDRIVIAIRNGSGRLTSARLEIPELEFIPPSAGAVYAVDAGGRRLVKAAIDSTDLSADAICALPVTLHYSIGDRDWTRVGDNNPRPCGQ